MLARLSFYPTLLYNVVLERFTSRQWFSRIDENVILGALPFPNLTRQLIEEENVQGVVSMNEDYELYFANNEKRWNGCGVQFLQLPTTDMWSTPCQEKLIAGVKFIERFVNREPDPNKSQKPTVYVHCKAGRTRSATLVGCYLIYRYGSTEEQAVALMREKRPHILLSDQQWKALRLFRANNGLEITE